MAASLQIGEVAALTGISAGRIRHYDALGLISPGHRESGYRLFEARSVLRLLHVDLLRSLGVGLEEIRESLAEEPAELRPALERHRATLAAEHARLGRLLEAVERALGSPDPAAVITQLAEEHRRPLWVLGRLERPLPPATAARYEELFAGWEVPVPDLLGRMVLPPPVSELLERLAETPGHERLFERLRQLAAGVVAVVSEGDEDAADRLAAGWVAEQLRDPLPPEVDAVLRQAAPRLLRLPVIRHGFAVWAESIHPVAGRVLHSIQRESGRRGARALVAIVIPPAPAARRPA